MIRKSQNAASSLDITVFFFKITGQWHFNNINPKLELFYKGYAYFMFLVLAIYPTIAMTIYVIQVWGDLIEMAEGLYFTLTMLGLLFKFVLTDFKDVRHIIEVLNEKQMTKQTLEQDKFVLTAMKITKRNIILILGSFSCTCWAWTIASFLGGAFKAKRLPKMGWYYFDTGISPTYEIIYFYQTIAIWLGALMNGSLDALICGLMVHAGGQIDVLKHSLGRIRQRTLERMDQLDNSCDCKDVYLCNSNVHVETNNEELENEVYKEVMECIKHHQIIIKFVINIETTFHAANFVHFFTTVLVICITFFELTILKPFSAQFFSLVSYVSSVILQIFIYCYYGNEVFIKSSGIGNAIYTSEWYRFGPKVTKAIWILMERAKKPLILTGGKLFILSNETFTSILKSSYSYYAVLRQMNADVNLEGE